MTPPRPDLPSQQSAALAGAPPTSGGGGVGGGGDQRRRADLQRARAVAKWTDARFLDPLVGMLLPGVGDVLGATAGLYIVAVAVRHGVPRATVARMLFNVAVDCAGGVVPVVGDLFDVLNRANLRNVRLLEQHLAGRSAAPESAATSPRDGAPGRSLGLAVATLVAAG